MLEKKPRNSRTKGGVWGGDPHQFRDQNQKEKALKLPEKNNGDGQDREEGKQRGKREKKKTGFKTTRDKTLSKSHPSRMRKHRAHREANSKRAKATIRTDKKRKQTSKVREENEYKKRTKEPRGGGVGGTGG